MSIEAITHVWNQSQQKGCNLLVMLAIANYADEDNFIAWPSRQTLARKTRLDERSIRRIINQLVENGELKVVAYGKGRSTSRYQICKKTEISGGTKSPPRGDRITPSGGTESPPQRGHVCPPEPSGNRHRTVPSPNPSQEGKDLHQEFIRMWTESFAEVWGEKYLFAGGRDAKAVKSLLSGTDKSPQELVEIAKRAWNSPEKLSRFLFDQSKTLPCFASRFNEIITALKSKAHSNGHATIPPMTRLKIIKEQIEAHPANITSIKHDENCGEEKKQELRNLRAKRDQLEAEIANG